MAFAPHTLNKTVASAGTRIQFSTSAISARLIIVQANTGNSGNIFIGDSTVSSTVFGVKLTAGASLTIGNDGFDAKLLLSELYADASSSADGFSVLYY